MVMIIFIMSCYHYPIVLPLSCFNMDHAIILSFLIVSCFHNDIVFHTFHHNTTISCLLSVCYNPESALRKAQVPVDPILNTHFDTCRISEMQMKCASFAKLSFMTFGLALNRKRKEALIRCLRC